MSHLAAIWISDWTHRELNELTRSNNLLCVPIKGGYKIGDYTVTKLTDQAWRVTDHGGNLINDFYHKLSAVFYVIYTKRMLYNSAEEIRMLDTQAGNNALDVQFYTHSIQGALKNKRYDLVDILVARRDISTGLLENAATKLSKTFSTAKYRRIWEL